MSSVETSSAETFRIGIFPLVVVLFAGVLLCSSRELAAEAAADRWQTGQLTTLEVSIFLWLPEKEQTELHALPIDKVKSELAKWQQKSPWKCPWAEADLNKEEDGKELVAEFNERDSDERERLKSEVPLKTVLDQLRAGQKERQGGGAASTMKLVMETDPEVRNPGTSNAKVSFRGVFQGAPNAAGLRLRVQLRFPNPDSLPEVAEGFIPVPGNGRFQGELSLPRKVLLLGRYYLVLDSDYGKIRDKSVLKEVVPVHMSRVVLVGVDESYRNKPDMAPPVIEQDLKIKVAYLALLLHVPIEIGGKEHPDDSPDVPYLTELNVRLTAEWVANKAIGVLALDDITSQLDEMHKEMLTSFDPVKWRDFLDKRIYPAMTALEDKLRARHEEVLQERFPDYYKRFMDATGLCKSVRQYAAALSTSLYEAAGQELPAEDRAQIRGRQRSIDDCLNLIKLDRTSMNHPSEGASVRACTDLLRQLEKAKAK